MVRLGIIGCGAVTERHHLPALKRVPAVKVVALADQDRSRLEQTGNRYRIAGRYTNPVDLIDAADVDAVAVCLPPQLHAEVALAALDRDKHLFIEKPLALNLADCDLLIDASKRNPSRKVMVGFNLRWHRLVRQARDILNRNELGKIKLVRTIFTTGPQDDLSRSPWRTSPEAGGDVIFDLGVHHFDVARFLLGSEVESVRASIPPSEKTATVLLSMNTGAQVVCAFAQDTSQNQTIEVYGERGGLRISCYRTDGLERLSLNDNPSALAARLRGPANTLFNLPRALAQSFVGGEFSLSYVEEWNHFAHAIMLDHPAEADLRAGRRAVEIALAALNSK